MSDHPSLLSVDWLQDNLKNPDVVVLDSTYHLPTEKRDAKAEYEEKHIPGARFFDFDGAIKDKNNDLPHMLPDAATFAMEVGALGIGNNTHVVAYDTKGGFSAPRCWWMFKTFGHDRVSVLDGGLRAWEAAGHPVATEPLPFDPSTYSPSFNPDKVISAEDLLQRLDEFSVIDARSAGRFNGTAPEPRAGLRSGHIPSSLSLPFNLLLDGETGLMKKPDEMKALFAEAGHDLSGRTVTTCGSGVTAAYLAFALHLLGHDDVAVYDGSWTEWGGRDDLPIET